MKNTHRILTLAAIFAAIVSPSFAWGSSGSSGTIGHGHSAHAHHSHVHPKHQRILILGRTRSN